MTVWTVSDQLETNLRKFYLGRIALLHGTNFHNDQSKVTSYLIIHMKNTKISQWNLFWNIAYIWAYILRIQVRAWPDRIDMWLGPCSSDLLSQLRYPLGSVVNDLVMEVIAGTERCAQNFPPKWHRMSVGVWTFLEERMWLSLVLILDNIHRKIGHGSATRVIKSSVFWVTSELWGVVSQLLVVAYHLWRHCDVILNYSLLLSVYSVWCFSDTKWGDL